MPSSSRDLNIIRHILRYCTEIEVAHSDFGASKERFLSSSTYRNALSMPILQIGELANHLSSEFKMEHPQIPWKQIIGTRNFYAHAYLSVDMELIWETSLEDIQKLKFFCKDILTNAPS